MASPVADSYACASGGSIHAGRYGGVAGTGVTITDNAHPRLYQRVGSSKSITVAGTYSGSPSRIAARHCPVGTATNALAAEYPWSTLVNDPNGGTFSAGYLVPQGDNWIMQVRDGVNHSLAASGTHAFGVGIFVAMLGQSNMENMFSAPSSGTPTGSPSALGQTATASLQRIGVIHDGFAPSSLSTEYGSYTSYGSADARMHGLPIVYMANDLVAGLGCPVGMLLRAASGSSITDWQPATAYMTAFLSGLDAVGGDCEMVLWLQGETNAIGSMSAATYQSNLQNVFNTIKAHTGRDSSSFHFGNVVVGSAMAEPGAYGPAWSAEGTMGPIRKAQLDFVAANISNGAFLAGTCVDGTLGTTERVHIDNNALLRQGKRYTEAVKRRLSGATYNIEGPKIASASRSLAVVTVNITQQGGTALLDGAGGSGGSLLGFRVFDGGTPCTISSTAISGNTVVLTLSATPAGTLTLDYAMANAPFGHDAPAATICYDNKTIPGDTRGLPLQPKPLFTVS